MKIGNPKKNFYCRITWKKGEFDMLWTIDRNCITGKYGTKRVLWLCASNKKHRERIWGKDSCQSKSHFCLQIIGLIELDTAHISTKKLWGRLYLTRLFKKDYHIYSSENDVLTCGC